MRLIDADEMLKELDRHAFDFGVDDLHMLEDVINDMPTVEQKHGHWIEKTNDVELELICSNCKNGYIEANKDWKYRDSYCRWCGAKME